MNQIPPTHLNYMQLKEPLASQCSRPKFEGNSIGNSLTNREPYSASPYMHPPAMLTAGRQISAIGQRIDGCSCSLRGRAWVHR